MTAGGSLTFFVEYLFIGLDLASFFTCSTPFLITTAVPHDFSVQAHDLQLSLFLVKGDPSSLCPNFSLSNP